MSGGDSVGDAGLRFASHRRRLEVSCGRVLDDSGEVALRATTQSVRLEIGLQDEFEVSGKGYS